MIEYMPEDEATATRDITVTITKWDAVMLDRISEAQDLPVANVASAALNSGLHHAAEVLGVPRPKVDRQHQEGGRRG